MSKGDELFCKTCFLSTIRKAGYLAVIHSATGQLQDMWDIMSSVKVFTVIDEGI